LQHLKNRPQFQAALAGATLSRTSHFALHRVALDLAVALPPHKPLFGQCDVWVGAMVPKRWAKRAVTRNTIKRQIFALSRDYEPALQAAAHVIRLRAAFDKTTFVSATSDALKSAVRSELEQLFSLANATHPSQGLVG
jgi:ribonuclease P protein component